MIFPEIIICSAIKFNDTIICGRRHGDCYTTLKVLLSPYITPNDTDLPGRDCQGFMTSLGRYVDRTEAWNIAVANNQIRYGYEASKPVDGQIGSLISENLY
jgi:hypothetical protein